MMQHIAMDKFGGPEVLYLKHSPKPKLTNTQLLIHVAHAGVNRPDCLQRLGLYTPPPDASTILGLEVAGEIVDVGSHCSPALIGQKVCALVHGGGYSDYVASEWSHCLPVPQALSMAEAACLPETFFTVWYNVFMCARLQAGETFLVHGGSSGIGTTAIQLAKAFGACVFTTVSSDEKAHACKKLGADHVINYKTHDFVQIVREQTANKGVDVILDMVGGEYVKRHLKCLADQGRLSQIAFLKGVQAEINLAQMMMKRLHLTGSILRARSVAEKAAIASALRHKVWPFLEVGKIAPVMDQAFALKDSALAHQRMESGAHIGKIVLNV
ncbi:MAG: NAD(P)H-quinone oxidoreductase [Pseudomonadota bacterium]